MRITHEADYAVRLVNALLQDGGTVPARELARRTGVTIQFCLKILRKLMEKGIVTATKGASGGYRLERDPRELSLGEIIECIDGPLVISHCLDDEFICTGMEDKQMCRFHGIFYQLSTQLRKQLYSYTMNQFKD